MGAPKGKKAVAKKAHKIVSKKPAAKKAAKKVNKKPKAAKKAKKANKKPKAAKKAKAAKKQSKGKKAQNKKNKKPAKKAAKASKNNKNKKALRKGKGKKIGVKKVFLKVLKDKRAGKIIARILPKIGKATVHNKAEINKLRKGIKNQRRNTIKRIIKILPNVVVLKIINCVNRRVTQGP